MIEDERTPYVKPEIIHEMDLETRAGSVKPPCDDDLFDIGS